MKYFRTKRILFYVGKLCIKLNEAVYIVIILVVRFIFYMKVVEVSTEHREMTVRGRGIREPGPVGDYKVTDT